MVERAECMPAGGGGEGGPLQKGWSWPPLPLQPDKLSELLTPSSPADQSGECIRLLVSTCVRLGC